MSYRPPFKRPRPERSREELAWAAGFADGEGSFYLEKIGKDTWAPAFGLVQTDPRVLERFADVMGFGKVVGPFGPYKKGPKSKPLYSWRARSFEKAQAVLALLWTWLGPVKRKQATSILLGWREGR